MCCYQRVGLQLEPETMPNLVQAVKHWLSIRRRWEGLLFRRRSLQLAIPQSSCRVCRCRPPSSRVALVNALYGGLSIHIATKYGAQALPVRGSGWVPT